MNTIRSKVVAIEKDIQGYCTIVFENKESTSWDNKHIMTVVFPNWMSYIPSYDEEGFLTYNSVIAGKDSWYDPDTGNTIPYNYSNIIFIKFVPIKNVDNLNEIIL